MKTGPTAIFLQLHETRTTTRTAALTQPVAISGNALFGVRFQNASTRTPTGTASYPGSTDIKPLTPLIKQVKLVEDFERVLTWGAGLDHLAEQVGYDFLFRAVAVLPGEGRGHRHGDGAGLPLGVAVRDLRRRPRGEERCLFPHAPARSDSLGRPRPASWWVRQQSAHAGPRGWRARSEPGYLTHLPARPVTGVPRN